MIWLPPGIHRPEDHGLLIFAPVCNIDMRMAVYQFHPRCSVLKVLIRMVCNTRSRAGNILGCSFLTVVPDNDVSASHT